MQFTIFFIYCSILLIYIVQSVIIGGSFIVKLNGDKRNNLDKHIEVVKSLIKKSSGRNEIKTQFKGLGLMYHAIFSEDIVEKVRTMSEVEYVEADKTVELTTIQKDAPWGLARISQKAKLGKTQKYEYDGDGSGVAVYVLDTGIFTKHREFEGRARFGAAFVADNDNDESGHGTHVAGIIGSKTYGVAKKVELVSVKVIDNDKGGRLSNIISGVNWSVMDNRGEKGNVINMSLSLEKNKYLNDAVKAAIGKGFVVISSAGNKNENACNISPASESSAITVGATNIKDARAEFSNWGSCVTVFAPGDDIISTEKNGRTSRRSGTSMAAPHVAGLAACLLSKAPGSPNDIKRKIINLASEGSVTNLKANTPNRLVNNGVDKEKHNFPKIKNPLSRKKN